MYNGILNKFWVDLMWSEFTAKLPWTVDYK